MGSSSSKIKNNCSLPQVINQTRTYYLDSWRDRRQGVRIVAAESLVTHTPLPTDMRYEYISSGAHMFREQCRKPKQRTWWSRESSIILARTPYKLYSLVRTAMIVCVTPTNTRPLWRSQKTSGMGPEANENVP